MATDEQGRQRRREYQRRYHAEAMQLNLQTLLGS